MPGLKRLCALLLASSPQVLGDCSESLRKISNSDVQKAITEVQGLKTVSGGTIEGWAELSANRGNKIPCPYYWAPYCKVGEPVEPLDGPSQIDSDGNCKSPPYDASADPSDIYSHLGMKYDEPCKTCTGCCDKVKLPGPCIETANKFDKINVCVKRWEVRSLKDFDEKCRQQTGDGTYGNPYFISALAMKQAGSVKYFQKLEDNNFICIPNNSCDKTGIKKHLTERAQECVNNHMTSCIYWLTDIDVGDTQRGTDPSGYERYKKSPDTDFGYRTEYACTRGKHYGVVGELEEHAAANSDKNGELKVEQFQSMVAKGTYTGLSVDC